MPTYKKLLFLLIVTVSFGLFLVDLYAIYFHIIKKNVFYASLSAFIFPILILVTLYLIWQYYPLWDSNLRKWIRKYKNEKILALTFDDGPDPKWTPSILEILKQHKVNATFFCRGDRAALYPELVKLIVNEGHDLGSHTMSHKKLHRISCANIISETRESRSILESISNRAVSLFRTPHGFKSLTLLKQLKLQQMTLVTWTRGVWDTHEKSANLIIKRAMRKRKNMEIILMHDGLDETAGLQNRQALIEALPCIIDSYKQLGYRFVRISEL